MIAVVVAAAALTLVPVLPLLLGFDPVQPVTYALTLYVPAPAGRTIAIVPAVACVVYAPP